MNRAHLVPLALAFVAGAAADAFGLDAIVLGGAIVAAIVFRNVLSVSRTATCAVCATFALGMLDGIAFGHRPMLASDAHYRHREVVVVEAHATDVGRSESIVRLDDGSLATLAVAGAPLPIGERLTVRAKRAVFDDARNPGEPSLRELEADRGVDWRLERPRILRQSEPDERDVTLWIARARAWASHRLHATLGEPDATILAGAMWGERGTLAPELRAEFQDTGTVHVLVTAGLHLGVVAAVGIAALQWLRFGRVSAAFGAIAIVWAYAEFSGAHLPSVRAATMLTFALLARAAGREAISWNALAVAAIVVVGFRPASVASVSFALSFSCVAAIFAFASPLAAALRSGKIPHWASGALAVSFAAQLGTWPLTAATFLVIAPYAPLANVLVVPVVAVAMLVGFVALACASIAPLAFAATNIETSLLDFIVTVVRIVGTLPGARVVATPPPLWTIVVYDLACVVAGLALARERIVLACGVMLAASALCLWPPRFASHDLIITAIDVGQADAILIETPHGHAYLVDAGGRLERGRAASGASAAEDVGERVVVPFLIRAGIHHLDAVLLSHPHGDHAGGVAPVLRNLGADAFADSGQRYAGHAYADALAVARDRGIPLREPRGGDVWRTDEGVTFRFYGPVLPYIFGGRNDINDNSLVFRIEYGTFAMLFTGDAGELAEARLLRDGYDLHAAVLKVGHHGSAYGTSSDFVRAVAPLAAIVSVGRNNLFGHPAPQTLETLTRSGARIFRTDRDGAIEVRSDGTTFRMTPFLR